MTAFATLSIVRRGCADLTQYISTPFRMPRSTVVGRSSAHGVLQIADGGFHNVIPQWNARPQVHQGLQQTMDMQHKSPTPARSVLVQRFLVCNHNVHPQSAIRSSSATPS